MRLTILLLVVALTACTLAGQPIARFKAADHFTFSQGSADPRYGNTDSNIKITMTVFLLGQQVLNNASSTPETRLNKTSGSLDFTLKLSDFDPNLPPDTISLTGTDLGNDMMKHTTDQVLPGPYHIAGTFGGTDFDLTLSDVHVVGTLLSDCHNNVVPPVINPVLLELCDVQVDDPTGSNNALTAVPAHVSGWVISPIFTVSSMKVDVTGIQQAGQVPANVVSPSSFTRVLGRVDNGDVGSLTTADGNVLRVCKFIVPNLIVAPINVEVFGNLTSTPQYLSLLTYSRMTNAGVFQQTLDLYDFSTNGYATGDTRSDPINTTFAYRKLDATGTVSRYVGANGEVRARYRVKQTGPAATLVWCSEHDFVGWIVTP